MEDGELGEALQVERVRTLQQVGDLQRTFDDIVEGSESVALDDEHDPDGSTVAFERAQVAALLSRAQSRLLALDHAERRLVDGSFGTCERCGKSIAMERLRAIPLATNCVTC